MNINYEAILKDFKSKHDPLTRWKSTIVIIFTLTIIIFLSKSIVKFIDEDLGVQFELFVLRNKDFLYIGFGIIILLIIANVLQKNQEDIKNYNLFSKKLNEYSIEANKALAGIDPITEVLILSKKIGSTWKEDNYGYYYWQDIDSINFYPKPPLNLECAIDNGFSKKMAEIKFFEMVGEKFYENKISGGGSEGPNYAGAIVGGQLMGTAGAIVGGQQKIDPITSELIIHDTRKVRIVFEFNEGINELLCNNEFHQVLLGNLEEKNKIIFDEITKHKVIDNIKTNNGEDISIKFKKLEKLLTDGLITKEEYDKKRQKLIDEV